MSGTSLDGADAILADFSQPTPQVLAFASAPYPAALRAELHDLNWSGQNEIERSHLAANQLAPVYAQVVAGVLQQADVAAGNIRAIGCHGQTVRHRPDLRFTTQLNNAALIAELTGIDVVADFRSRDVASGGQGAPLTPAFHDGIFRSAAETRVVVNIGGIANISILQPGQPVWGFDCGPGNCLMDHWIGQHHQQPFDKNGNWAAQGTRSIHLLKQMQNDAYFAAPPPKSTGRDHFHADWLNQFITNESPADVQATLLELTAWCITHHIFRYAADAAAAIICGGGANNSTLLAKIAELLPTIRVETTDQYQVPAQQVEALAFAWLAKQCIDGEALDLTRTTGATKANILGSITRAG